MQLTTSPAGDPKPLRTYASCDSFALLTEARNYILQSNRRRLSIRNICATADTHMSPCLCRTPGGTDKSLKQPLTGSGMPGESRRHA
ncbi:hypothetical protein CDEST_15440 [Colletotrichum destructivum]|uniref:Uncharacterized protein n=1 Tax=Colletotrichum destructivum TaxID=34406 RepID=A0AAX4J4W6_9PEZI|nr:hypothetical protein CDEST_15440 [Colletotrichum destructivum]